MARPLDPVRFTRESAERIANVVQAIEATPPRATPLRFNKRFPVQIPKQVRAGTFNGSWPINTDKTVTFTNAPTATATVRNLSWPITLTAYSSEPCIVGKDGTSWYLVVPVLQTATAVFVTQTATSVSVSGTSITTFCTGSEPRTVLTGVDVSATLNTNNCTITIGKTASTAEIRVVTGTATAVFVGATATAVAVTGTATSSFLRIRVP